MSGSIVIKEHYRARPGEGVKKKKQRYKKGRKRRGSVSFMPPPP